MGKFRDGMPVTGQAVTLILTTIDRYQGDSGPARSKPRRSRMDPIRT